MKSETLCQGCGKPVSKKCGLHCYKNPAAEGERAAKRDNAEARKDRAKVFTPEGRAITVSIPEKDEAEQVEEILTERAPALLQALRDLLAECPNAPSAARAQRLLDSLDIDLAFTKPDVAAAAARIVRQQEGR